MPTVNRLAKLKAMSAHELWSRVRYKGYTWHERRRHMRATLAPSDRLRRALVPDSRDRNDWRERLAARSSRTRFFASLEEPERARHLFAERYTDEQMKARRVADEVARGDIGFFGRQFHFGARIDWHADPLTGAEWPRHYHADVPVHGGNVGYGDVKDVWEINRHQFFVDLAKVALLDHSAPHANALHALFRDWTSAVPYATGAPWACALEPAFRVWSWMWAYHMVEASGLLEADQHVAWLEGFWDHGRFLHRHLEYYSSPYNHLIGEASALFALGLLFPEFREARAWEARGRGVLESTLPSQFYSDGGTVEQSTFYHHATLGFYLLASILARRNAVPLSPNVDRALERALHFSAALVQPDGRVPRIGGADDGKPIRLEHLPFWDFRPYQAIGAVLFARADFRFVAQHFWEDAFWLLGADGAAAFDRLAAHSPAQATALPASGYYIARSEWSADADYLCVDCGEQAAGLRRDDVPSAAHGHADCLSVIVTLGGREVLVDPGFFCYNGDPAWEAHFRKTLAHNTVVVDGLDQAQHIAKMAWKRTYSARPEAAAMDGALAWVQGSHDGFIRQGANVTHRRTAWLRPDGYVVLRDELTGTPGHTADAVFQFAPGDVTLDNGFALYEDRFELHWVCSGTVEPRLARGGDTPASGWIATSLGVREAASRLNLRLTMQGESLVLLTVLMDRHRRSGQTVDMPPAAFPGLLCARVVTNRAVDEIRAATGANASSADLETDAPLVILRREGSVVQGAWQAGGTRVRAAEGSRTDQSAQTSAARPARAS
jgi:hypothetical protein